MLDLLVGRVGRERIDGERQAEQQADRAAADLRAHGQAVHARGAAGLLSDGRRLLPPTRTADMDRDSLTYTPRTP